jgi:hypothetical protein
MSNAKLIEIKPAKGLNDGLYPSAEPTAGAVWKDGRNAWFREMDVRTSIGKTLLQGGFPKDFHALAQAGEQNFQALYWESDKIIYAKIGAAAQASIHAVTDNNIVELVPWGQWLIISDNTVQPKLWKGSGSPVNLGGTEFTRAKIFKKIAARALAFSTNVYPAGFHWCNPKDLEDWTVTVAKGTGNLPIRSFDSEIMAVAELAGALAVYSKSRMVVVQILSPPYYFGTPTQAISGCGAVGKDCIIAKGSRNFGLSYQGFFLTDGSSVQKLGRPPIDEFIQEKVDFSQGERIIGFDDTRSGLLTWVVPLLDGTRVGITLDESGKFSILETTATAGIPKDVYPTAIIGENKSLYNYGVTGTLLGDFQLKTHLLDAGSKDRYKVWEYAMFEGTTAGSVRFGFTDEDNFDTIEWNAWEPMGYRVPFTPRESVYFAMEIKASESIKLSGITVYGGQGGLVL